MTTLASNVRSVLLTASEIGPLLKLRRRSILFAQEQDSVEVFLIESGLVKLTRVSNHGGKLIPSVSGPGQLVGEECFAQSKGGYLAESVCLTEVTGYRIPIHAIKRLLDAELGWLVIDYVIALNREVSYALEMQTLRDVEHRLLYKLATLAALVKPSADGTAFSIPMTHAELADFVGASRETVSGILGILKNRRLLTLSRGLVTTVRPDMLIDAANDRADARPLRVVKRSRTKAIGVRKLKKITPATAS